MQEIQRYNPCLTNERKYCYDHRGRRQDERGLPEWSFIVRGLIHFEIVGCFRCVSEAHAELKEHYSPSIPITEVSPT